MKHLKRPFTAFAALVDPTSRPSRQKKAPQRLGRLHLHAKSALFRP